MLTGRTDNAADPTSPPPRSGKAKRKSEGKTTPRSKRASERTTRAASADGDLSSPRPIRMRMRQAAGPSISMTDLSDGDGEIEYAGTKHYVTRLDEDDDGGAAPEKPKKKAYLVDSNRKAHPFFGISQPVKAAAHAPVQASPALAAPVPEVSNPTAGPLELALRALRAGQGQAMAPAPTVKPVPAAAASFNAIFGMSNGANARPAAEAALETGWGRKTPHPTPARLPRCEDVHVRPDEDDATLLQVDRLPLPRRQRVRSDPAAETASTIWSRPSEGSGPSHDRASRMLSNSQAVEAVPSERAIDRDTQLWIDKYRPRRAEDVIENKDEATYLRDWLKRLEIAPAKTAVAVDKHTSKTEIQRKVVKAKRQRISEFDQWLINDGDPIADFGPSPAPSVADGEVQAAAGANGGEVSGPGGYPSLVHHLCNSILLSGSTGCGKTAAVYAVAEELDWDVFEVYPGIGKRSGLNLGFLVGDVSKNHTVVKGHAGSKAHAANGMGIDLFANQKAQSSAKPIDAAPVDLTIEAECPEKAASCAADGKALAGGRQSLILLEEVDVLFEEDKGFWQALVALIADSRRPVILTCNGVWEFSSLPCFGLLIQWPLDESLVPRAALALQTTLYFEAPTAKEVATRLSAISTMEGRPLSQQALDDIMQSARLSKYDALKPDKALPPGVHPVFGGFDLRHSICQLQSASRARERSGVRHTNGAAEAIKASPTRMQLAKGQGAAPVPTLLNMQEVLERWSLADICIQPSDAWLVEVSAESLQ